MTTHPVIKSLAALSASFLLTAAAQAATYTTVFGGDDVEVTVNNDPVVTWTVAYIEVVWATSVAEGNPVGTADLSDLSFSLYNDSDAVLYTDNAIVGGVVQPLGGVSRTLADITFNAISGTRVASDPGNNGKIQSLDNDLNQVQFGSASGSTFNIYGVTGGGAPALNLASYFDGGFIDDATFNVTGQNTTGGAIPEPSSAAALTGLACLGLVITTRRKWA